MFHAGPASGWAKERIREIMERREMTSGDVSRELGFSPLNAALGNALRDTEPRRLRDPKMLAALEQWLEDNASV